MPGKFTDPKSVKSPRPGVTSPSGIDTLLPVTSISGEVMFTTKVQVADCGTELVANRLTVSEPGPVWVEPIAGDWVTTGLQEPETPLAKLL